MFKCSSKNYSSVLNITRCLLIIFLLSCVPPILKSKNVRHKLEIPHAEVYRIGELPIPVLRASMLINNILYLNTSVGLVFIDIYAIQWYILRKFGSDTIIVDFNVSNDNQCIIYSLIVDAHSYPASNFISIIYEEKYKPRESTILHSAHNKIFHSLYWIDNKTIAFIEKNNYREIAKTSYLISISYNESFNIIKKEEKLVKNFKIPGIRKLDMYNDTLIFWFCDSFECSETLGFPLRCYSIAESFLKLINIPLNVLQPVPQHEPLIYHYKISSEDVIRLVNLSTGKMANYYIGDCVAYAFTDDGLLFRVKHRYASSFWSWERRPSIIIEIEELPQNFRSTINSLMD